MENFVITITRQFGSLGRPIAREMSEMLGIEYYDRDIVEETSKRMSLPVPEISEIEETAKSRLFNMKFPLGNADISKQNAVFEVQANIISDLAEANSCIIVGRCADYILRNKTNRLDIFIYAPYEARLQNCIETLHMEPDAARKMITSVDNARDLYHKRYAKYLPGDPNHKDILISSATLGSHLTAEVLCLIARKRFGLYPL